MIRWLKCKLFHDFKDSVLISSKQIDGISKNPDFVYRENKRRCKKCDREFRSDDIGFRDGLTAEEWFDED